MPYGNDISLKVNGQSAVGITYILEMFLIYIWYILIRWLHLYSPFKLTSCIYYSLKFPCIPNIQYRLICYISMIVKYQNLIISNMRFCATLPQNAARNNLLYDCKSCELVWYICLTLETVMVFTV